MARKPRIEFPGALNHVLARGNRKEKVFLSDDDFQKYLALLSIYKKRYSFKLYAYALMANHLHLLLETSSVPLSRIMQGLQQSYTQFYNRKYEKVGHVFQGRYKAIICQEDVYLLELVRYVHLNPVRAGIDNIEDFPWTSYHCYLSEKGNDLVDTTVVLSLFGKDKKSARSLFKRFIYEGLALGRQEKFYAVREQRVLGNEDFVEGVLEKEVGEEIKVEKKTGKVSLKEIAEAVGKRWNVLPAMIKTRLKNREVTLCRRWFIYLARVYHGYTLKEIAAFLGSDISTITKNAKIMVDKMKNNQRLASEAVRLAEDR